MLAIAITGVKNVEQRRQDKLYKMTTPAKLHSLSPSEFCWLKKQDPARWVMIQIKM